MGPLAHIQTTQQTEVSIHLPLQHFINVMIAAKCAPNKKPLKRGLLVQAC